MRFVSTLPLGPAAPALSAAALLPLGAVIMANLEGGHLAISAAQAMVSDNPWCPVCLGCPIGIPLAALLSDAMQLTARKIFVDIMPGEWPLKEAVADAALRREPIPIASDLAAYVAFRTNRADLKQILQGCMTASWCLSGEYRGLSRSGLSRRLQPFGTLTAREWRSLAHTIMALQYSQIGVDEQAARIGVDARTLRDRCRHFLGLSPREASATPGWEWCMELALRRAGYIMAGEFAGMGRKIAHQLG